MAASTAFAASPLKVANFLWIEGMAKTCRIALIVLPRQKSSFPSSDMIPTLAMKGVTMLSL